MILDFGLIRDCGSSHLFAICMFVSLFDLFFNFEVLWYIFTCGYEVAFEREC